MTHRRPAGWLLAALMLAQTGAPSSPGIPQVSGTRTPEQSPATAVAPPSFTPGTGPSSPSPSAAPASAAAGASQGPAYSFGAAPPPIAAPGR